MIELRFKLKPLQFSQLLISTACTFYCSCCLLAQSCPTLCDPMDITCQAPLSMGFSRQEYCSGLPFPFPGCMVLRGGKPRISLMGAVVKKILLILSVKHSFIYTDSTETDIQISVEGQLGKLAKKVPGSGARKDHKKKTEETV